MSTLENILMQTPTECRLQDELMREIATPDESSINVVTSNERQHVIQKAVEMIASDMKLTDLGELIETTADMEAKVFEWAPTKSLYYAMVAKIIYNSRQVLMDDVRRRVMQGSRNGKHTLQ